MSLSMFVSIADQFLSDSSIGDTMLDQENRFKLTRSEDKLSYPRLIWSVMSPVQSKRRLPVQLVLTEKDVTEKKKLTDMTKLMNELENKWYTLDHFLQTALMHFKSIISSFQKNFSLFPFLLESDELNRVELNQLRSNSNLFIYTFKHSSQF
jgi:hypothetical protein